MARLLDTNVRFFGNEDTVAQLENEFGAMIKVLDEVLVNGSTPINVVMIRTVEDPEDSNYWLSTVTLAKNHTYKASLSVVQIEGCSEGVYNNIFRIQSITDNTVTIAFDKSKVPDKPNDVLDASGTKIKLPPLGYEKTYQATNKAAYKTKNPLANKCYLRVDDSQHEGYDSNWLKRALVSIYSDLKNIDDYVPRVGRLKAPHDITDPLMNEEPNKIQDGTRFGVSKWIYTSNYYYNGWQEDYGNNGHGKVPFEIIGDDRTFYLFVTVPSFYYRDIPFTVGYVFGEYEDVVSDNNIYNFMLGSHLLNNIATNYNTGGDNVTYYSNNPGDVEGGNAFSRGFNNHGKFMLNDRATHSTEDNSLRYVYGIPSKNDFVSGRDTMVSYYKDNTTFNLVKPSIFSENWDVTVREFKGFARGYYVVGNNLQEYMPKYPSHREIFEGIKRHPEKTFVLLTCTQSWSSDDDQKQNSRIAFELNNWR